jgi:hypothetical protein
MFPSHLRSPLSGATLLPRPFPPILSDSGRPNRQPAWVARPLAAGWPFIEPPQADVLKGILKPRGWGEPRSPCAPSNLGEWVLDLGAAYSGNSRDAPKQAVEPQELTYVEVDTFLTEFE